MRAAYVTTYDPLDVRNWSGTGYYIARCLTTIGVSLDYVGPLQMRFEPYRQLKRMRHLAWGGKRYLAERDPKIARDLAAQVENRLIGLESDLIVSPGTIPVAFLGDDRPLVFWADATFAAMIDFYPGFSGLCKESLAHGLELEARALERASLALYASDWAARSAIEQHGADPTKVAVVPFGANLEHEPNPAFVEEAIGRRPRDVCRLLFLGVDWYRKGGDVALDVAQALNDGGLSTELHVVGCEPPLDQLPSFVTVHGFIGKESEEGRERLVRLLASSHFLILPSRSECYGLALCEANAYGVPCVTSRSGGIPTIMRDGVNGMTFPAGAAIDEYASYISTTFADEAVYTRLARSSFTEYQRRLNWSVSGRKVRELLATIV